MYYLGGFLVTQERFHALYGGIRIFQHVAFPETKHAPPERRDPTRIILLVLANVLI